MSNPKLSYLTNKTFISKTLLMFFLIGLVYFLLSEGISSSRNAEDQKIELVERIVIAKTDVASGNSSQSLLKEEVVDWVFILANLFFFLSLLSLLIRWMLSKSSNSRTNSLIKLYALVFILILVTIPAAKEGYVLPFQTTESVILLSFFIFLVYRSKGYRFPPTENSESQYDDEVIKGWEGLMHSEKIYRRDSLRISDVAKLLKISQTSLSRNLKLRYNKSFNKLINECRINESKVLLKDPAYENLSIEGIAFSVGFNTRSSFYNAFIELEEMSPGQFKSKN